MFISEYFTYDGIDSRDFDIFVVRDNGENIIEATFGISQSIVEETIKNRPIPFFYGVTYEPLTFRISIAREDEWTDDIKQQVVQWLFQKTYKPFISSDNLGVAYYCMPTGQNTRFFNSLGQGYAEIEFRCDAPWGWSYPQSADSFDLTVNPTTTTITLSNLSNIVQYYEPEIEIQMMGTSTDVTLTNHSDGGRVFEFTNLQPGETVYVHNYRKQILSDVPNVFRLNDFNKNWLRLVRGDNTIEVAGECIITVRSQFPISM